MLRNSSLNTTSLRRHSIFDISKNSDYECAIQLDDVSSPIDRYGIDFTSIMPPWIPCDHKTNFVFNYLLLEFQLPVNYFDVLELEKNKYYWSVSIWLNSCTRLSSDLILHYNSTCGTFLYAFEIPNDVINKELSAMLLFHLVVKLIHSETSIPLAHSLIHLSVPICPKLKNLQNLSNKPVDDVYNSDNALQSLARLRKLKSEHDLKGIKTAIQSSNSIQLNISKCTQISIEPSSLISILEILPKKLVFPSFNVLCSVLPSHSSASHWKVQNPFNLRLFPSFVPSPRDIMCHLLTQHENYDTKLRTNEHVTIDPENIIAVERRIYLTVTELQLCPDLLKMCTNSNLIISAQGICNNSGSEAEKKANVFDKNIFLGTVYNQNGDWLNQVEIKSSINIGDRIDKIKFIVSLILYTNGKVQNQLLCEGDLISYNCSASNDNYQVNSGLFDVLLKVPIKSHTHGKCIVYPESIGKITVKVDITGDGLDHPSIVTNAIMIKKYNATLDAFLSLSATNILTNDTLHFNEMIENVIILGLVDSFACLASCTSRIALMKLKINVSTYSHITMSQIMLFIEVFATKLTQNSMCDRNTMLMIGKILSDDILYAAHLAFALWLHYWVEEQNLHSISSSLHLATSLNDLVDEPDVLAEVSKYEMSQNSHRFFNKEEFSSIRTACACLSLLRYSRTYLSGYNLTQEEQFKILHSFMLDSDSIDKLSNHLMRKILSHGTKLLENLIEKMRNATYDILEKHFINENIFLTVEKFQEDVDNILSIVVECVSLVIDGSGILASTMASVILSFISTTITALRVIATLVQKVNIENNMNYIDNFGIERLSILLTLISYILDSQSTGLDKLYSKGPTSLGSGPLGRDLQRYSSIDAEAALCNEYITNAIISITDYISNVSTPLYLKIDSNSDISNDLIAKNIYSSLLLINSLSSMSLTISTMITANLQNFVKLDTNYDDQVYPHVHISASYLSGEQALEYATERATFLEVLYGCSKSASLLLSTGINNLNIKSTTRNLSCVPEFNLRLIFSNRLILDDILNCVMKGLHNYDTDVNDSAISIIFRTITYQSHDKSDNDLSKNRNVVSNLSSYHIVTLLSHAVLSISQYWHGIEILLQNKELYDSCDNSNNQNQLYMNLKLNGDAIVKTLHFDLTILKEAASTLCILCSNDSQLSVENMYIFIQKNDRYKHKKGNNTDNNNNSAEENLNNFFYRSDIITAEDALEGGPIMQWLRLWQILVISLSDIIKSLSMIVKVVDLSLFSVKKSGHQDDNIFVILIRMLIEISLLMPIRPDDDNNDNIFNHEESIVKDISRPDLALFCLEQGFIINKTGSNKHDSAMIILKILISTASSLIINDNDNDNNNNNPSNEYRKVLMANSLSLIINSCIDLLVLLQDMSEPVETSLESLFIDYIINLVGLTLPHHLKSKRGDSINVIPSLNVITSLLCSNIVNIYDYNITVNERRGYSHVIQEVYQVLLNRGKGLMCISNDHSDYFPILMINKMFNILQRKLACYRCYIFGIMLSYDLIDEIDTSVSLRNVLNQLNNEQIIERLQWNYAILFSLSSLQYLLSNVLLSKNYNHIDIILNEFTRIYSSKLYSSYAIGEKLNIKLIQSKQISTVTNINNTEKMKKEREINRYTKFISNPCKLYGYGYFGACEMIKLYLHDNHKSNNKYSAMQIEKGQQIIRSICKELLYAGEWDVCYRMLENRLDIYKNEMESHLLKSPAHNRYLTLINELELTKEKLLDHGNHDTHNRPCPLYYAVKFSISPLDDIINNFKETDIFDNVLNDFYYATCCDDIDIDSKYNYEEIPIDNTRIYQSGTWIILRCDATSYLTGSSLYSEYILSEINAKDRGDINDYKDNNERLPLFLPPQCYDNIELLLCKAFPSYHLVSPNEHQNFNNRYKSMQLFQAFPTNMLLEKNDVDNHHEEHESTYNDEYWENMIHSKSFYVYSYTNNDVDNINRIVRYTIETSSITNFSNSADSNDNDFMLIKELNWCAPSSLGFVNNINFFSSIDVLIDVLDCQTLSCQPLIKSLSKLISLTSNELYNQPSLDITNQMSIIMATISNIANIINYRSICIGYHNASEIIGAETERRELMWQERRKSIKQGYIRNKNTYDELYNSYMNNSSYKNNKKIAQVIYDEHGLDAPIEPNYQSLEKEYHDNNNNDVLINDLHNAHEDAIKIIETTISLLRDFINIKYDNSNMNSKDESGNAGDVIKKYGTDEQKTAFLPKFSASNSEYSNIHNEESLVYLQLILWLESKIVSLDFRSAII